MGLSLRQIRYLYATGVFKSAGKAGLQKTRPVSGTHRQITRELGKIGSSLSIGETSSKFGFRVGDTVYPIQKDRNGSSYPSVNGRTKSLKDLPEGAMSIERLAPLGLKRIPKPSPKLADPRPTKPTSVDVPKALRGLKSCTSEEQAYSWGYHKMGISQGPGVTEYQQSSGDINSVARFGRVDISRSKERDAIIVSESKKHIERLDREISAGAGLPEAMLVHRGISGPFADNLLEQHQRGQLIGSTLGDTGFVSTSLTRSQIDYFQRGGSVRLEIELPKGTKALYLGPSENEILLGRDSDFVVRDARLTSRETVFRLQYRQRPK